MASLKLYGADWCSVTRIVRAHLLRSGVQHDYVDLDRDPGAVAKAVAENQGERPRQVAGVVGGGAEAADVSAAAGEPAPLPPRGEGPPPLARPSGGDAPVDGARTVKEVSA